MEVNMDKLIYGKLGQVKSYKRFHFKILEGEMPSN